jgi:glycosyltransferase involved in cell wall biosynthesis
MSARRTRVLFVVGNFVAGGAERHLLELWSRIDRTRFDVAIACFRNEGQFAAEVNALGWPVHELGVSRRIYDPSGCRGLVRLLHLVRDFRPDAIHGYLFGPNLFAVLAGRLCGVPAVLVAKRNVDAFETKRQVWLQSRIHRWATHVTAVSESVADTVVQLGVPRDRVTVIPNGVDAARFGTAEGDAARRLLGMNGGVPILGSVGCLAPRKDYATLLDALALLSAHGQPYQAALIGDGPERERLEARANVLGIAERVHFLGERADVERLLPGLEVFVLSSREEGIPNALLEAMAAGRPAVATAVGGTPEVLQDGETGWLVPAQQPERLAQALEQALADPTERARRGRNARDYALEALSIEAMTRRHEQLYETLGRGRAA